MKFNDILYSGGFRMAAEMEVDLVMVEIHVMIPLIKFSTHECVPETVRPEGILQWNTCITNSYTTNSSIPTTNF